MYHVNTMFDFLFPQVPQVESEDVKKAIDTKEKMILLDVRTDAEYAKNRLHGSINVPVDQIANRITAKIPDKSAKIYVYCLSGSRSTHAVSVMVQLGYTNVYNMKQGLLAWRAKGLPVLS